MKAATNSKTANSPLTAPICSQVRLRSFIQCNLGPRCGATPHRAEVLAMPQIEAGSSPVLGAVRLRAGEVRSRDQGGGEEEQAEDEETDEAVAFAIGDAGGSKGHSDPEITKKIQPIAVIAMSMMKPPG